MSLGYANPPPGWTINRLKDVARLNPEVLPETTDPDLEIEYVDIGNLSSDGRVVDTEVLAFADAPSRARRLVRPGDTIISTVRTYLRAVAYLAEPQSNLVVSTGFAVLRPRPVVHPQYLGWLVRSDPFIEAVMARSQGVSYPAIAPKELGGLSLRLPPVDQQRAIADYLDRETAEIGAVLARKDRLARLLEERHRCQHDQLIEEGFRPRRLKQVAEIKTGPFGSDLHESDYVTDGIPVINPGHIARHGIEPSPDSAVDAATVDRLARHILRTGDVVGARRGELGRFALVRADQAGWLCGTGSVRIRVREGVMDPRYALLALSTRRVADGLVVASKGSTMDNLNVSIIGDVGVPVPGLDEQRAIVERASAWSLELRRQRGWLARQVRLLRERRGAVITAAVTGQFEVREAA